MVQSPSSLLRVCYSFLIFLLGVVCVLLAGTGSLFFLSDDYFSLPPLAQQIEKSEMGWRGGASPPKTQGNIPSASLFILLNHFG